MLTLIGRGSTNVAIATQLFLGFAKLGARDRTQALIVAYESGLVRPGG